MDVLVLVVPLSAGRTGADEQALLLASENCRTLVNPDEARFIDMNSVAEMVTEEREAI